MRTFELTIYGSLQIQQNTHIKSVSLNEYKN